MLHKSLSVKVDPYPWAYFGPYLNIYGGIIL